MRDHYELFIVCVLRDMFDIRAVVQCVSYPSCMYAYFTRETPLCDAAVMYTVDLPTSHDRAISFATS